MDPILEALQLKIREYMNECADHLAGGGAKDFSEYKYITGKIEGEELFISNEVYILLLRLTKVSFNK